MSDELGSEREKQLVDQAAQFIVKHDLEDFAEMLGTVDLSSIVFHMERGDFEKWMVGIFGDQELSEMINRRKIFQGENLRKELEKAVKDRIEDLKAMSKTA